MKVSKCANFAVHALAQTGSRNIKSKALQYIGLHNRLDKPLVHSKVAQLYHSIMV
jgi:hypothetical protein